MNNVPSLSISSLLLNVVGPASIAAGLGISEEALRIRWMEHIITTYPGVFTLSVAEPPAKEEGEPAFYEQARHTCEVTKDACIEYAMLMSFVEIANAGNLDNLVELAGAKMLIGMILDIKDDEALVAAAIEEKAELESRLADLNNHILTGEKVPQELKDAVVEIVADAMENLEEQKAALEGKEQAE